MLCYFMALSCIFCYHVVSSPDNPFHSLKYKFEEEFHQKCSYFPFVQQFIESLERPFEKFIIFSFHDPQFKKGGFGDRMAGLLTAFGYALRTNRTLLIRSNEAFQALFRKYHPSRLYTWRNWAESNWTDNYAHSSLIELRCLNSGAPHCLFMESSDSNTRTLRLRSNRMLLCYWLHHGNESVVASLKYLGITNSTNLYLAAGCMLRLVMWPTDHLWERMENITLSSLISAGFSSNMEELPLQIGLQYRCGDVSFKNLHSSLNECYSEGKLIDVS
jgi:hypothetical protein